MKKRYKVLIVLIILAVISLIITYTIFSFIPKDKIEVKVLDSIDGYTYNLENRDTQYYVDNFNILKEILSQEEIDYEKYAEQISILFITDLYTINNKINKYDVGGTDFVLESFKSNYNDNISDTMYKYLSLEERTNLPEVKSVSISSIEESIFNSEDVEYEAYEIDLTWEYIKNLGYDESAKVVIIKKDNILSIAQLSSGVENE